MRLKIGWAEESIAPDKSVALVGQFAERISEYVEKPLTVTASFGTVTMGSGANSPLWCQMKADMTKKTLVTLSNKETACLGGAILVGVGTGVFDSVESAAKMIKTKDSYTPQGIDYTDAYKRYLKTDGQLNIPELGE